VTQFLLILVLAAGGSGLAYRTQREQARRDAQAAGVRAELANFDRDRAVAEAARANDRAARATDRLAASEQALGEERRARHAAEVLAEKREEHKASLVAQHDVLRTSLIGDHDGPVVVCDRRDEGRRATLRVSFGLAAHAEDEQSTLRRLISEADPRGTYPTKVAWLDDHEAWDVSVGHLSSVLKRLPLAFGRTRFIHITSTKETCNSRCLDGVLWSDCKCQCGGEHHGSGDEHTSRDGWHKRGWHHIIEKWQRHEFDLDPHWYYNENGEPRAEIRAEQERRASKTESGDLA
jgi:hypothetical protein